MSFPFNPKTAIDRRDPPQSRGHLTICATTSMHRLVRLGFRSSPSASRSYGGSSTPIAVFGFKFHALVAFALALLPGAATAQFVDTFDVIDPAWVANRYAPAGFTSVSFGGDNRLQLTIDQTGSTANRDVLFSSAFYETQGMQRPGSVTGSWILSAQVFVSSSFNTATGALAQGELWGHSGSMAEGGAYMILGFTNASPTDALNASASDRAFRFRAYDPNTGAWSDLGVPGGFAFDAWHTLSGVSTGASFDFLIDDVVVQSIATSSGVDLISAMVQGHNFGQAASYSVLWDNVSASAIPEPAAWVGFAGGVAAGFMVCRRRRMMHGGRAA
jgi:hypothetical protein